MKNEEKNSLDRAYKSTKQRQIIMDILERAVQPLTAEDIFLDIKQKLDSISLSTVYRNLEMLLSKNIINKELFCDNKARYELKGDKHRHKLICKGCNMVVDIDECPIKAIEDKLKNETDFDISDHKIEIYGYCPRCKRGNIT